MTKLVTSRNILRAKQGLKLGRIFNQRFVSIPFARLVDALKLYAAEHGIELIDSIDEAYTSKTNCIHGDVLRAKKELRSRDKECPKMKALSATVFHGRRLKGAFICLKTKMEWHSDLNGALNHIFVHLSSRELLPLVENKAFKLHSPRVLKGLELYQWLDEPYRKAA